MLVIITTLVKATGIAVHTVSGRQRLEAAQRVHWHQRLEDLEDPAAALTRYKSHHQTTFGYDAHIENLHYLSEHLGKYPLPSQLRQAVIIACYNESLDVIEPTLESVAATSYNNSQMIVLLAYEERGGEQMEKTARYLEKKFKNIFGIFELVKHPRDMPDEVIGKGGNITYAGKYLRQLCDKQHIQYSDVIVTTLDCDNRPHHTYFDYVAYEYIVHDDRKRLSYQPIALFLNNIWDAPAPMRVVATGNSFWNIISSMRPHTLRNFASHSQPLDALVEMDFWSTRTIVEDGHQYWRSYFHFKGDYSVMPIYVPIYQDAVLSNTYVRTLKAQFIQLRRWAYGASDIPYVATRIFTRHREVPFWPALARLIRLIDGHVTLAVVAILVAFGGWIPLLINTEAAHNIAAHQLPEVISGVQRVAMVGLFITVFLAFKMLPPRPERYKRRRSVWMVLQWVLMPITGIVYSSASAFTSQTALLIGHYFDKFDVTEKATVDSKLKSKKEKAARASEQ
jgi:cellulose synthase/poly-beta-1,6-N-acetylglucosamine synthase-like glycosyltransferase